MIKAVIFDMDGVISDTLPLHSNAESETLLKYGIHMTPKEMEEEFNAAPDKVMFETIFKRSGKKLNYYQIRKEKWENFEKLSKQGIKPVKGSLELINQLLKNGFILAIASSSPVEIINLVLDSLKIKDKFKTIVHTDEVQNGKPAPDLFLLAAKRMSVGPNECLVIEDAQRGIEGAKAAGMKCIAITTTHSREQLNGANKVIDSLDELTTKYIKSL